jgi:hypothetical protein
VNVKSDISRRLREVRHELFGEHGGPELARRLNLPARTWYNYETGVTVPAEVLLSFIEETGTYPQWLLTGQGPKYRRGVEDMVLSDLSASDLIRRGLAKLEELPSEIVLVTPENLPSEVSSEFVAVQLLPMARLATAGTGGFDGRDRGHILAYRQWIPHPRETIAVCLEDDAMHPILPIGSVAAVDRAVSDPSRLNGRMVAACPDGIPMIRWLELSGKHLILRPNQPSREFPIIPIEWAEGADGCPAILGQVVWSWSRFSV